MVITEASACSTIYKMVIEVFYLLNWCSPEKAAGRADVGVVGGGRLDITKVI